MTTDITPESLREYTPTTDAVRAAYDSGVYDSDGWHRHDPIGHGEQFDRWLAAHDAEVARKALMDAAQSKPAERHERPHA